MKTVIVTPELWWASAPGDIGAFAWHWSRLLRQAGDDVHVILTRPPLRPTSGWRQAYDDLGVSLDVLEEPERFIELPYGYRWQRRIAELVFERMPADTDIVYYADRDANGMHHLRRRRYRDRRPPVAVMVLHGGSSWRLEGARRWPTRVDDLERDFYERYVTAQSDWVIVPSRDMLGWVTKAGWALPAEGRTRVAGYPYFPESISPVESVTDEAVSRRGARFRKLVCYSVPAAHADIALFADALKALRDAACMDSISEVVLLGCAGAEPVNADIAVTDLRVALPAVTVTARLDATPDQAQALFEAYVAEALVVMPMGHAGLDYGVIAASLVPGLNLLCSDVGGNAEVLGEGATDQLFEPFRAPLARAMERWLLDGPRGSEQLGRYAWREANERWLALHQEIAAWALGKSAQGPEHAAMIDSAPAEAAPGPVARAVDVCIPYYNLGAYLPTVLEALARQSCQDFNVFVVNDGSTDTDAEAVFARMRYAYADRANWRFVTTANQGVCATRNLAASLGTAEYVCFVDADNIPVPTMIERFVQSIRQSGDDCLTCYQYTFEG